MLLGLPLPGACGLGGGRRGPVQLASTRRSSTAAQRRQGGRQRPGSPPAAGRGAGDWSTPPPADAASWDGGAASTDSEDDDYDLDLFPEEAQGDPEFVIENVLALVLIGLASLAAANILFKLLIVAYALVSAAVRYTAVGVLLALACVAAQPGRWWF